MHLWAIMIGRARVRKPIDDRAAAAVVPGSPVLSEQRVGAVLEAYPELLPVFLSFGFKPLRSAVWRKTLAPHVTIARACRFLEVDEALFLKTLNLQRHKRAGRISLPMVVSMPT
jgi:hypothetical protein